MDKAEALEVFSQANQKFDEEAYSEAINLYEKVEQDFNSAQLYHNLGLAYYYNEDLANAILNIERALKIRPSSSRIKRNLRLLNENVESEIVRMPAFFLKSWYNSISNLLNPLGWLILNLIFLGTAVFLLYQYLIKRLDFGLHFYYIRGLIIGLFVLSLLFMSFGYNRNVRLHDNSSGIVMASGTKLRIAAEENSQEVMEVAEGVKVFINDEINNFYKIKLEDLTEAWVLKERIEKI
jgi:tetratricopeptide (TPR) repeat protein